jgi:hypothetical protein
MNIASFDEFKLNEIGDRIITPKIVKRFSWSIADLRKVFFYNVEIENDVYQVVIQIYNPTEKSAIKMDFGKLDIVNDQLSMDMTNSHLMLEVMSNLVGVFKQWVEEYPGNETIFSIIIGGKSEVKGDSRRSRIYDEYIKRNVERFGVKIKEAVDITKEWVEAYPEDALSKVTKYRIEPISLDKIRKYCNDTII